MLVAACLRHIAGTRWGTRKYLDMERLREPVEDALPITTKRKKRTDLASPRGKQDIVINSQDNPQSNVRILTDAIRGRRVYPPATIKRPDARKGPLRSSSRVAVSDDILTAGIVVFLLWFGFLLFFLLLFFVFLV